MQNGRGRPAFPETPGLRGSAATKGKAGDGTAGDLLKRMLGTPGTASGSAWKTEARYEESFAGGYDGRGAYMPPPPYHNVQGRGYFPPPPPPPPKAAAAEGNALKELLSVVAPQARITEKGSQLTTKASARILGKVLGEAKASSSGLPKKDFGYANHGVLQPQSRHQAYGTGFSELQEARRPSFPKYDRDELPEWALPDADDSNLTGEIGFGKLPREEDDDEDQFMQRWNGLFSKGSPLVEGTATDPFKDDLRRRAKVAWKKPKDRAGHRARYQKRRQEREQDRESAETGVHSNRARSNSDPADPTDEDVSLVFDASKLGPEREALRH